MLTPSAALRVHVLLLQVVFGLGSSALFAYFCLVKPARNSEGAEGLAAPLLAGSSSSLSGLMERRQHHQQADMRRLMATALKVAVAGVVAGVVGIGGGMLMAPMLLDAGIHPQVRSPWQSAWQPPGEKNTCLLSSHTQLVHDIWQIEHHVCCRADSHSL